MIFNLSIVNSGSSMSIIIVVNLGLSLIKKSFISVFGFQGTISHPFLGPGSHLSSHTVASIVLSAALVLTVVFGMGTGVTPERIATGKNLMLLASKQ